MADNEKKHNEKYRIVEMYDDEGNCVSFEHLMTLEYQNRHYIALGTDSDDEDATDVIIARIDQDTTGMDIYTTDIPEDTRNKVFDMVLELISDDSYVDDNSE